MTTDTFTIKTGSDGDLLFYQFSPKIDLTGATVVFSMKNRASGAVTISLAAATIANGTYIIDGVSTVLAPTDGVVFYAWTLANLLVAGDYEGEFKVTKSGKSSVNPSFGRKSITISEAIA